MHAGPLAPLFARLAPSCFSGGRAGKRTRRRKPRPPEVPQFLSDERSIPIFLSLFLSSLLPLLAPSVGCLNSACCSFYSLFLGSAKPWSRRLINIYRPARSPFSHELLTSFRIVRKAIWITYTLRMAKRTAALHPNAIYLMLTEL